jgi:hypothetical protein
MAVSNVQIANRALQKLGAKRIEALSQDHANARSMNAAFELVRDAELRRYHWSFATRRDSIAADASDTAWGDWNRYTLPNDFLGLIRDDETGIEVDWRIEAGTEGEGAFIITADASPLEIRYIARVEDPNSFDPLFIEAFACKLALETCEEITQSTSRKESIRADYKDAIAEARRVGAIEKPAQEFVEDEWVLARL